MLDDEFVPSEMQKQKFNRYYDAINNPVGVIKQMRDGDLHMESIEALATVKPELYRHLQHIVSMQIPPAELRKLPQAEKRSIAMFLGQPLKSDQLQPVMAANQAIYAQINQGRAQQQAAMMGKPTATGMQKIEVAKNYATKTERGPVKREDRKSTRLNSSHIPLSRMPSSA